MGDSVVAYGLTHEVKKIIMQTGPEKTASTDLLGKIFQKFSRAKHKGIPL